jgi:hypothetical protein
VFDQASTVAPLTLPAHASLFTGLFPPGHGLHGNGQNALGTESITLEEQLKARGFRTGAFVSGFVLDHRWDSIRDSTFITTPASALDSESIASRFGFGPMTASMTPQSISGTLAGGFALRSGSNSTTCSAADNQVVFTRR